MPVDKLQALQRVLESEFCTSIREVYEHVYDTVDIGGSAEVRASATAKVQFQTCFCLLFPYLSTSIFYFKYYSQRNVDKYGKATQNLPENVKHLPKSSR